MSSKSPTSNSVRSNNCDPNVWGKAPSTDLNVKFAGEEAKDRMYEPKHKKKLVRVLTVIAYIFFVSLAAIMLSLYYVFIWKGSHRDFYKPRTFVVTLPTKCSNAASQMAEAEAMLEASKERTTSISERMRNGSNKSMNFTAFSENPELTKRAIFFENFFRLRREKLRRLRTK